MCHHHHQLGTHQTWWMRRRLLPFIVVGVQLFIFFFINNTNGDTTPAAIDQRGTAAAADDPDYTICDEFPKRRQKACKMVLQMGAAARKAEKEGGEFTEDELPPPSVNHGFLRKITDEIDGHNEQAQLPPRVFAELYACMNISCLCKFFEGKSLAPEQCSVGGTRQINFSASPLRVQRRQASAADEQQSFGKAQRMEYRMLSDQQRQQFHDALQRLKRGTGSYEYDRITFLHSSPRLMPSAHSGPTFLLWHREYLKRFEIALRAVDPSVALPYWDSTMDQRLDDPTDSIMWSDLFAGSTDQNGYVVDGFLANWITSNGDPVRRNLGSDGDLLSEEDIDSIINKQQLEYIFGFPARRPKNDACTLPLPNAQDVLEFVHNSVHTWVGGDMDKLPTSPQDPIFFMHHSFIDLCWEQWRQKWQSREQRATQFPPDSQIFPCAGSRNYLLNATMLPFYDPIVLNNVGLSNEYTDNLYTYAPRPTCESAGGCGSDYLFCDTRPNTTPLCCAKIKLGGNCSKFAENSEEPCYASSCVSGRCQLHNNSKMHQIVHSASAANDESVVVHNESSISSSSSSTLVSLPLAAHYDEKQQTDTTATATTTMTSPTAATVMPILSPTTTTTDSGRQQQQQQQPITAQTVSCDGGADAADATISDASTTPTETTPTATTGAVSSSTSSGPSLGVERECYDNHECCAQWAVNGSCRTAPRFMNTWCPNACRYDGCRPCSAQRLINVTEHGRPQIVDVHSQCQRWAHFHEHCGHGEGWRAFKPGMVLGRRTTRSECQRNRHWMGRNCPEACRASGAGPSAGRRDSLPLDDRLCNSKMPKDFTLEQPPTTSADNSG